jgi:hypothetical protein
MRFSNGAENGPRSGADGRMGATVCGVEVGEPIGEGPLLPLATLGVEPADAGDRYLAVKFSAVGTRANCDSPVFFWTAAEAAPSALFCIQDRSIMAELSSRSRR